ncbi:SGNH/GDSL hydrolase family protein [Vibrio alginolyticus]|uniref:SGNH/GDSL hydrolase family protein n=1 Tax=Vibrio alginolyticus TaxID=663 RepID=UPI003D7E0741
MNSSNNYFQLVAEFEKNIDWLNQILKGGEGDSVNIEGNVKPSISKDIADKWSAISAMVQGRLAYETKTALIAAGSPPPETVLAEVWRDPTEEYNGLYGWNGSGWEKSPYDKYQKTLSLIDALSDVMDYRVSDLKVKKGVQFGITDLFGNSALHITDDGEVHVSVAVIEELRQQYLSIQDDGGLEAIASTLHEFGITDPEGNIAVGVSKKGELVMPGDTRVSVEKSHLVFALTDLDGNAVFTIDREGNVSIPKLIDSSGSKTTKVERISLDEMDSIALVGDSHTESIWTLKDKAYISILSALTDYKLYNFGISGNDALDMTYRVVNDTPYFDGVKFSEINAKHCFIADRDNDGYMFGVRQEYWQSNIARLIQTIKANGTEPIVCTEFNNNATQTALMKTIAMSEDAAWVDNAKINHELGRMKRGAFFQGHPGTRTNGVFWVQMLDYLRTLPRPNKSIKIFRKRPGVVVSSENDLLYGDIVQRAQLYKELSVTHRHLTNSSRSKFEELDQSGHSFEHTMDEYWSLREGNAVSFDDYGLIEVTVPGTASTISDITLLLPDLSENSIVYVRNVLDTVNGLPGKSLGGGISPGDTEYQKKWDSPVGGWRKLEPTGQGRYMFSHADINQSLIYDKLQILIHNSSGFAFKSPSVEVKGQLGKVTNKVMAYLPHLDELELLAKQDAASLNGWQVVGSPSVLVPIDNYNCPRKPGSDMAVEGVITVSSANKLGQVVSLPSADHNGNTYQLTVWARYFPKAYLDNSIYNFDSSQVVDRFAYPNFDQHSPITEESNDIRTLKCEWLFGSSLPSAGGIVDVDFTALAWRPVTFYFYQPPGPLGTNELFFQLSCPDGEIQIAKCSLRKVLDGHSY